MTVVPSVARLVDRASAASAGLGVRVGGAPLMARPPGGTARVAGGARRRTGSVKRFGRRRPTSLTHAARSVMGAAPACVASAERSSLGWLALIAGLTSLVVVGIGWSTFGAAAAPVPQSVVPVQVQPGETLWDLAQRAAPDSSTSAVIDRIRQLNGLSGTVVYPGEVLEVPHGPGGASGQP